MLPNQHELGRRRVLLGDDGEVDLLAIDDAGDLRVADLRRLNDASVRRPYERDHAIAVAEGDLVVRRAVEVGASFRCVLVAETRVEALADVLDLVDAPVYVADRRVVNEVVGFDLHRGVVASIDRPAERTVEDVVPAPARRLLVVEGVNDPENLGSLFRTAAGLGADAVVLDPTCADPLYRRSLRVSMGHALALPWARARRWPEVLGQLRAEGWTLAAMTPAGAVDLDDVGLAGVGRLAVLVGAEGPGLSPPTLATADVRVAIPMAAGVDSLNVATSAGVALWTARPAPSPH